MPYQVTCPCGHRFNVADGQIGRSVGCPACNRLMIPVIPAENSPAPVSAEPHFEASAGAAANPPPSTEVLSAVPTPGEAAPRPTKTCPFCGETILAVARKCRYCGEFLDRDIPAASHAPPTPGVNPPGAAPVSLSPAPAAAPSFPPQPDSSPPVFILHVSQWDNFFRYLVCATALVVTIAILIFLDRKFPRFSPQRSTQALIVVGVAAIDLIAAYLIYMGARSARAIVRPNRVETEVGLFSKRTDAVQFFRIKDVQLRQNFIQRLLGIGTVIVLSSDEAHPALELYQIPSARQVYKYLQNQIPAAARQGNAVFVEK